MRLMHANSTSLQAPLPRILIVDDCEPLRLALRALISSAIVPCTCVEASTGEHAVALAEATHPTVVLMDLMLPGMNGIEATRTIKAMLPQTKIVIVSLHEAPEFQTEAARAGATVYLPKRVLQRELVPLLRSLLAVPGDACPPATDPQPSARDIV